MKTTIGPVDYYPRESDAKEAFAIRYAGVRGPVLVLTHGMGERSPGGLENLVNVVDGFDYDGPDGPLQRQYAIENTAAEAFAKKYGITLVTVTYPSEFNPNDYNYVLDMVTANYNVDPDRLYIDGFSLGGGAVLRDITSSLANASRLAGAAAAAPVNWATNIDNVVNAELQFIGTTYATDNTVAASNVKNFVAAINAKNPKFPAHLTIYPGTAHGGFNELLATEAFWQWMVNNSRAKRIPYTGAGSTTPTTPTTMEAIINYTRTNASVKLDGSKSTGYKSARWKVISTPVGVNPYSAVITSGGGWITATATLPKEGDYVFELELTDAGGTKATSQVKITYGVVTTPVEKTLIDFSFPTKTATFSDNTTEQVAEMKTVSGKTYTL